MKKLILMIGLTLASTQAFAKDSTWLICKGKTEVFGEKHNIVLNVFEHRGAVEQKPDGEAVQHREADLTLIMGGWVLKGTLDSSDSYYGNVELSGDYGAKYAGSVYVIPQASSVNLNGTLTLRDGTPLVMQLKCQDLSQ